MTPRTMKSALRLLPVLLALGCLAMSRKQAVTVRFYAEANKLDGGTFASPVKLHFPEREAYIEKIPAINEQNVKAIYPFQADDGSWGAYFYLDTQGKIRLDVVSTERRGASMVAVVGTAKGAHQVIDMIIDKPIRDGIITIPRGLTELEIAALTKEYPVMGQGKKKR